MSGSGELPAIEGSGMGLPLGMARRALSYDDNLEAPMSTPPHDISINNLWRRPVIPERRFTHLAEEDESAAACASRSSGASIAPTRSPVVVKAKASSIIMNSLITTEQTHDSVMRFEQTAGLTDTSYTPHKGLTAEETRHHHRMPDSLHKLQIQTTESREDSQSAQSTPSSTPHSSPKQKRRSWFSSTGSELSVGSNTSMDLVGGGGGGGGGGGAELGGDRGGGPGGAMERWSLFGPRPVVQKTTSDLGSEPTSAAGFALQAYRGAQKPTAMEVMKAQATRLAEDGAAQRAAPPQMEIPVAEGRSRGAKPHKLKPRDMNILTPSGF